MLPFSQTKISNVKILLYCFSPTIFSFEFFFSIILCLSYQKKYIFECVCVEKSSKRALIYGDSGQIIWKINKYQGLFRKTIEQSARKEIKADLVVENVNKIITVQNIAKVEFMFLKLNVRGQKERRDRSYKLLCRRN